MIKSRVSLFGGLGRWDRSNFTLRPSMLTLTTWLNWLDTASRICINGARRTTRNKRATSGQDTAARTLARPSEKGGWEGEGAGGGAGVPVGVSDIQPPRYWVDASTRAFASQL